VLIGLVLFIALLISETWVTVTLITLIYLFSIPFAVLQHRRELRAGVPEAPDEPVLPEDEI